MNGAGLRNRAILLAGAAAIMPVASLASAPAPAAMSPEARFQPPLEPMVLTRTLHRPLPDGAEVKTSRRYEIRFVADGNGYRIDGELVDTVVDAPPVLDMLSKLERNRPDTGMFPMRLDAEGRLLPTDAPTRSEQSREAAEVTLERVDGIGLSASEAHAASDFVNQFRSRAGRTAWPEDLFNPAPGLRSETRTVALPDGVDGKVSIEIEAHTRDQSGVLASFARTVTTDLGGDTRVTRETWTLTGES